MTLRRHPAICNLTSTHSFVSRYDPYLFTNKELKDRITLPWSRGCRRI